MFDVVILPVHFLRSLFCYFDCVFFYINDEEETNLIARSSYLNLQLFLKVYKYYKFKQNKPRAYFNFIKYLFYLQEVAADFPKRHLLRNFFCWTPSKIFFWIILRQVSQQLLRKRTLIFIFFPLHCQFVAAN